MLRWAGHVANMKRKMLVGFRQGGSKDLDHVGYNIKFALKYGVRVA
jgi:hypothetical protein